MYARPKESADQWHGIYNGVVEWLDALAPGPGNLAPEASKNAPNRRLGRQARSKKAGNTPPAAARPTAKEAAAEPAE